MDSFITIASFVLFTGLVGLFTWIMSRRDPQVVHPDGSTSTDESTRFFLAGRSLTFPFIAGSLLLTNLSTEQMVGLNGAAFKDGLSVMAWEVVAVIALVVMALFFLPRFLRSGIATVPQFLKLRYDGGVQTICNIIFLLAYMMILLPVVLYSGAVGLSQILDLKALTGIADGETIIWLTVWMVGLIGSVYALFGGLRAVAISDSLNGIGLLTGGFLIVYFGLQAVSGGNGIIEGWNILHAAQPEKFHSLGTADQSVPFSTLFTGVLVINMFYWCTNQQIIQRTLGARNLAEGQKGVLLCGLLKLLGPLYLVLPGIIAYYLYAKSGINGDYAYGTLVSHVLPPYLGGLFAAVMMGAVLSSFNSALNSTCTIFSLGIYKEHLRKNATERQVVASGKFFGGVIALGAMTIAPLLYGQESIFGYIQKMNAIYFIPIFSVVLVGLLARRVPAAPAKIALVAGVLLISLVYFFPPLSGLIDKKSPDFLMNEFHFVGAVFAALILFMLIYGKVRPQAQAWIHQYSGEVELTPWRGAWYASAGLVAMVLLIYLSFL